MEDEGSNCVAVGDEIVEVTSIDKGKEEVDREEIV